MRPTAADIGVTGYSTPLSWGAAATTPSVTRYLDPGWAATDDTNAVAISVGPGTLRKLRISALTAPGTSQTAVFTVLINGSSSGITATLSGAVLTISDLTHTATVVEGDLVTLQIVSSLTSGVANVTASLEWVPS